MVDLEEIDKAEDLLLEGKVFKLNPKDQKFKDYYVVTGSKHRYLVVLPNFCTCMHFQISCIKEQDRICKHILAARISSDEIDIIELEDWQQLIFV